MELKTTEDMVENIDVDAIILGVYEDEVLGTGAKRLENQLESVLDLNDFNGKSEQHIVLYNVEGVNAKRVVLVGLGKEAKTNHEAVRVAASLGLRKLRGLGVKSVGIEALNNDPQSTAEGVVLGLYRFDELKKKDDDYKEIDSVTFSGDDGESKSWNIGVTIAQSQNEARRLAELPSNIGTPTYFVNHTKELFSELDNIEIIEHDEDWAKERGMNSFLSVASGSDEPAKFMEIHYKGGNDDDAPIVYIGKGITFDTGGISIKPSSGMGWMRGDCGGAAAVIGSLLGIAKLGLPVNIIGITPLTENMPSGKATKPSDVVFALNGKSIEIDNTDAEGRLILADALVYAEKEYKPDTVIDLATLTGSMMIALGDHYIGTFTRSDALWDELEQAGLQTFEKVWRMPLDSKYKKQLKSNLADVKNVGGRPAGAITAAMFLGEFIEMERWAHMDIAGVAWVESGDSYKPKGMTGMPVRALIRYAQNRLDN